MLEELGGVRLGTDPKIDSRPGLHGDNLFDCSKH